MMNPSASPLRVLVFGAGAIGSYVGGSLALSGQRVLFIERPLMAAELSRRGLKLDLAADPRRRGPARFSLNASQAAFAGSLEQALQAGPFDAGIFALKSFDTPAALEAIKPHAEKLPPLLCLSNGVDNEPLLAGVLGEDKVIAGTVTSAVGRPGPGEIVLERLRGIGLGDGHPLSDRLAAALDAAGLNARLYPRPLEMKWSKLLTNLVANATSAILDMTPAEVFAHPGLYALEMRQLREALAVMRARRLAVVDLPGTPVRLLALAARLPALAARPLLRRAVGRGRGAKMPSFHIDLHSRRGKSEVDFLNGAVVRAGEQLDLPTPVNRLLNETLLALTQGAIPLEAYTRQPQALLASLG
jgi:2-dehydropantoate 2-reductase